MLAQAFRLVVWLQCVALPKLCQSFSYRIRAPFLGPFFGRLGAGPLWFPGPRFGACPGLSFGPVAVPRLLLCGVFGAGRLRFGSVFGLFGAAVPLRFRVLSTLPCLPRHPLRARAPRQGENMALIRRARKSKRRSQRARAPQC